MAANTKIAPRRLAKYKEYTVTQGRSDSIFYLFKKHDYITVKRKMEDIVTKVSLMEGSSYDEALWEKIDE